MLDHQHGALARDAADQHGGAADVLATHAGGGLVQQQQLRLERERGRKLERAALSVRELAGLALALIGEADILKQRVGARIERLEHGSAAPEREAIGPGRLQRDAHVLARRHRLEDGGDLKRTHHAEPRHRARRFSA